MSGFLQLKFSSKYDQFTKMKNCNNALNKIYQITSFCDIKLVLQEKIVSLFYYK